VLTALAVSGLPTDRFAFEGFPPRKSGERRAAFTALASEARTLVFFEAPSRLAATLHDMAAGFGADRRAAVCRELTKLHEEVVRGGAAELAERYAAEAPRGEVVLVVGAAAPVAPELGPALVALRRVVEAGAKARPAAAALSELTGVAANDLYRALTDGK
jgi:16S rRNA (cytidine1402-2'-O)-methyltransferase